MNLWLRGFGMVAPFAGAWIEIYVGDKTHGSERVAPFAGAWIEIAICATLNIGVVSLPSRERGLKCRKQPRIL